MSDNQDPRAALEPVNEHEETEVAADLQLMRSSKTSWDAKKSVMFGIDNKIRREIVAVHEVLEEKALEMLNVAASSLQLRAKVIAQMKGISGFVKAFHTKAKNLLIDMEKAHEDIATFVTQVPSLVDLKKLSEENRKVLVKQFKDEETDILAWISRFNAFQNEWDTMKGNVEERLRYCLKMVAALITERRVTA